MSDMLGRVDAALAGINNLIAYSTGVVSSARAQLGNSAIVCQSSFSRHNKQGRQAVQLLDHAIIQLNKYEADLVLARDNLIKYRTSLRG